MPGQQAQAVTLRVQTARTGSKAALPLGVQIILRPMAMRMLRHIRAKNHNSAEMQITTYCIGFRKRGICSSAPFRLLNDQQHLSAIWLRPLPSLSLIPLLGAGAAGETHQIIQPSLIRAQGF